MSDIITLAMTGASGAQYGIRLLECLVAAEKTIFLYGFQGRSGCA